MTMAMANGLQDLSGNTVHSFTQVINNSSTVFNDQEAPTLTTTRLINDGQTFTLNFNEPLDSQGLDTTQVAQNFKVFVNGTSFGATFDNSATTLSADGTSLTLKLDGGRKIEATQQVLISYEAPLNNDVPGSIAATSTLSDTSGNDLQSFTFNVSNESAQDFTAPRLTGAPNVEPAGLGINIPFTEMVVMDDATAALSAFTVSIDGTALRNDEFSINANGGASLQITLSNRVYNDQTLTVAYNPAELTDFAGELKDNQGNSVASFNQLINTSGIPDSSPDLTPPQVTASSTSVDGQTISLNFSEELSTPDSNSFRINLDGRELGMGAVENITQNVNGDGSSTVEIKLFANQAVGQGQSLVVAYDPDSFSNALFDDAGNQVAAFQQAVNNSSEAAPQDLVAPDVTSGDTDPTGLSISLAFDEQLQQLDAQQLDALKSSLRIVVDGHELPSVDAIDSLSINNVIWPCWCWQFFSTETP